MERRDATRNGHAAEKIGTSSWGTAWAALAGTCAVVPPPPTLLVAALPATPAVGERWIARAVGRSAGSVERTGG